MATVVDLVTNWELLPDQFQGTVMSDKRDFTRPREPFQASTSPTDLNMADTNPIPNPFIMMVQNMMRFNKFSAPYSGPINGELNNDLISVLKSFQEVVANKTGKTFSIISGSTVNPGAFASAMKAIKDLQAPQSTQTTTSADTIKAFQSFFSSNQPIIGKLYSGPVDGILNPELESAAKKAESIISSTINNKKVYGSIWNSNSKSFNTSTADITNALGLILKHNAEIQANKIANFAHKSRILALSKLF